MEPQGAAQQYAGALARTHTPLTASLEANLREKGSERAEEVKVEAVQPSLAPSATAAEREGVEGEEDIVVVRSTSNASPHDDSGMMDASGDAGSDASSLTGIESADDDDERTPAWSARTESAAMRSLVDRHALVFAEQRKFADPSRQRRCDRLLQTYFATLSSSNSAPATLQRYCDFCDASDIPPFPISSALIALAVYALCSLKEGRYVAVTEDLRRFKRLTAEVWAEEESCQELSAFEGAEDALVEFLAERKRQSIDASTLWEANPRELRGAKRERSPSPGASDTESEASSVVEIVRMTGPKVDLPSSSTTFLSVIEAYKDLVKRVIPLYGVGLILHDRDSDKPSIACNRANKRYPDLCPFEIVLSQIQHSGRWKINYSRSNTSHSHLPMPKILADPSWRPTVRNPDARDALGMKPLKGQTQKTATTKKKGLAPPPPPPSSTKRQDNSASRRSNGGARTSIETPPAKKPRQRSPSPPPVASTSRARHPPKTMSRLIDASSRSQDVELPRRFLPPPPSSQASSSLQSTQQQSQGVLPRPPAHQRVSSSISTDPSTSLLTEDDLSAFLLSLHPSLAPLAPHLLAAGIDTLDTLATLPFLDTSQLEAMLDVVRQRSEDEATRPKGSDKLSVIQCKLFARKVREAAAE